MDQIIEQMLKQHNMQTTYDKKNGAHPLTFPNICLC